VDRRILGDKDWVSVEGRPANPGLGDSRHFISQLAKASGIMAIDDLRISAIEGKREETFCRTFHSLATVSSAFSTGANLSGWE